MGRRSYLGGHTTLTHTGFGFTRLPEGGQKVPGKSKPTPNQVELKARSERAVARLKKRKQWPKRLKRK